MDQKYTDSDEYQKEIADQYAARVTHFPVSEVQMVLTKLGFDADPETVTEAVVGNVNATYLTPTLVVKMNKDTDSHDYIANKLVSDRLGSKCPVVKVLAYDFFEKTDYEVLVMERSPGTLLLNDMLALPPAELEALFARVVDVVQHFGAITFDTFGPVSNQDKAFGTYTELLSSEFKTNVRTIRDLSLCEEADIQLVEKYFAENVHIFNDERPVLVHTDLHMGNILHDGGTLTAIIDFDSAERAPLMRSLISLLGLIDNPSQFVEGTKDFVAYKGKNFYHLLPILRRGLSELFADPLLLKKLNVNGVAVGIMWIAGNWSAEWNKEMMFNLVTKELATSDAELKNSYFGKIISS
ncbi:MAG: aminoglycoside phosphotransferase family protein [Patescibacteria group bacterium]